MKKKIKVKQLYIDEVKPGYNGSSCPIALAIKDQLGIDVIITGDGYAFYSNVRYDQEFWNSFENKKDKYILSKSARQFIEDFDCGERHKVKPFNFILDTDRL